MTRKKTNRHIGSSFDDFLDEEGIQAEVTVRTLKEVIAWLVRLPVSNPSRSVWRVRRLPGAAPRRDP